jgi:hypothetical protein
MIKLGESFQTVLDHIKSLGYPEQEICFSIDEPAQYHIDLFKIPLNRSHLDFIWVEKVVTLIFDKLKFIGYAIDLTEFVSEDYNLHEFETYTAQIRNKLSPFFCLPEMLIDWDNESDEDLKQRILPYIIAEAKICQENKTILLRLLRKIEQQ